MLVEDLIASAKRWQEWMGLQRPEEEPLPGDSNLEAKFAEMCISVQNQTCQSKCFLLFRQAITTPHTVQQGEAEPNTML